MYLFLRSRHIPLTSCISSNRLKSTQVTSIVAASENLRENDEYQYIQRSELPTMFFQRSLPRLPIPKLELTCQRYLAAVHPLMRSDEEYDQVQREVADFKNSGIGSQLHNSLLQYDTANKQTSYISKFWSDMYLRDRSPLPLNYNPVLIMNNGVDEQSSHQFLRTTNLIISSLRFWRSLNTEVLEPEVFHLDSKRSDTPRFRRLVRLLPPFATYLAYTMKAYPLDMSQYAKLFGTTRIPQVSTDILQQNQHSRHILLMRRGNMYAVDVLCADGTIENPTIIYERILATVNADESRPPAAVPIGALTTSERDTWAQTRDKLVQNARNERMLREEIDGALFCVCLESEREPIFDAENPVPLIQNLLAGNSNNRWFDKSISLLVSRDGTAAINFEHSWGDGVAVLRYFNQIYKDVCENNFVTKQTTACSPLDELIGSKVRLLQLDCEDSGIKGAVRHAQIQHDEKLNDLQVYVLRYADLHRELCKNVGISPDAIMQLSFQLAYYRAYETFVGSYESCSTAAFRHGRTEALRPCTKATKKFCMSMNKGTAKRDSSSELFHMIEQCSQVHSQLTREAAMGQGFDRHLFALREMGKLTNTTPHKIFNSKAYERLNNNIISTSTLNSQALYAGAFGPVVPDGLGIGYSIRNNECGAIITCYGKYRDGKRFVSNLEEAFDELQTILSNQHQINIGGK